MTDSDDTEANRLAFDAAEAATKASRDAVVAAQAAADTVHSADVATARVVVDNERARRATAATVAATAATAAAVAAAEVALRIAQTVEIDAAVRALDVAAAAARASETAAAVSGESDVGESGVVAAAIAATVAAEVIVQARLTEDAASMVADAVALAADAAASAAVAAADLVEETARTGHASAQDVVSSSAATETASGITVESTRRVTELALSRVARLRHAPMVAELHQALEAHELRLHFQPQYSMATGAIMGVEALIRWQHPSRGLLHPVDFLEVAEGPHLVTSIGDWVLGAAVAQATAWQRDFGDRAPVMWANVSCDQLGREHLTGVIEQLFSEYGLPPRLFGVEVTERQLARRVDDVAGDLLELRELGVALAVDDFGTGYASLDYLRRFVFDQIKIDRSFVSGIQDRTNMAITSSIITLARALDLTVVAEGVETQEQFDRLRKLGCDLVQGYLLQRPAAAESVTTALHGQPLQRAVTKHAVREQPDVKKRHQA